MNALNLGTQPEHRQLHSRDELEDAATMYGASKESLRSAISCGMPKSFTDKLTRNMIEAKSELEAAAIRYFEKTYDGATE